MRLVRYMGLVADQAFAFLDGGMDHGLLRVPSFVVAGLAKLPGWTPEELLGFIAVGVVALHTEPGGKRRVS